VDAERDYRNRNSGLLYQCIDLAYGSDCWNLAAECDPLRRCPTVSGFSTMPTGLLVDTEQAAIVFVSAI